MRASLTCVCAALIGAAIAVPATAQQLPRPGQLPPPGGQAQPSRPLPPPQGAQAQPAQQSPAASPAKPYTPVAVKLPAPIADPSFDAFRKQLAESAQKKDRAALTKLVVAQGFFWEAEDGDKADKKKAAIDNLGAALGGFAGKDASAWELLQGYSGDPTATPHPEKKNVVCAPADPSFDDKALEDLAKATQTDPSDWGYPVTDGLEVRAAAQANAAVVEKLGMNFVRVMQDTSPPAANQPPMLQVVTPSGKTGYVSADSIAPLGNDQICYVKEASGWKIAGFIGGEQ